MLKGWCPPFSRRPRAPPRPRRAPPPAQCRVPPLALPQQPPLAPPHSPWAQAPPPRPGLLQAPLRRPPALRGAQQTRRWLLQPRPQSSRRRSWPAPARPPSPCQPAAGTYTHHGRPASSASLAGFYSGACLSSQQRCTKRRRTQAWRATATAYGMRSILGALRLQGFLCHYEGMGLAATHLDMISLIASGRT